MYNCPMLECTLVSRCHIAVQYAKYRQHSTYAQQADQIQLMQEQSQTHLDSGPNMDNDDGVLSNKILATDASPVNKELIIELFRN